MSVLNFGQGSNPVPESRISTGLKWVSIGSGIAFATLCARDYMRCHADAKQSDITAADIDAASDLPDRLLADGD